MCHFVIQLSSKKRRNSMTRKHGITRRQFLLSGVALAITACAPTAVEPPAVTTEDTPVPTPEPTATETTEEAPASTEKEAAAGSEFKEVPRNRTLIMAGLGGEHPGAFLDVENFNLYAPGGISRSGLVNSATEGLFYANMLNVQEIQPWVA